ncbi:nucleotide exchange factor GrpE [Pseudemcibacter aquimaris]|uniref:nucleotide exchange factor GrpE n=1 Tax=Pseudemcibacter aquimaris TaxID=2857064 RepID=UPI0020128776|nr:nucleotide exchange factor GrpE [Pseudemcibacter aquimaris]MCC3860337.1 nucleotide exchange factor GrpE [Pseudemcibacter aquimaris]WDU57663.1 nucleotide exchange factor GrpE [Pseudemcibacter aquimaris]
MTENTENEEMNEENISEEENNEQPEKTEEAGEEVTPLSVAEAEINDLRDKLLRAVAEAENVRRRAEKEKADAANYAVTNFARDILAVADNLHRALESLPEEDNIPDHVKNLLEGVKMTDRELHNIFERHGINKINPHGEAFDHNHHQAMFEAETDEHPHGTVMQVMQVGYKIKDRLLRPAMVGVSKGGNKDKEGVDTKA